MIKVKAYNIDWDVIEEDLEGYEGLTVEEVKSQLPSEVVVEVEDSEDEYELCDRIVDAISEQVGWLVDSYDYQLLGE